jgi:nicotinamide-nucleotide amidase
MDTAPKNDLKDQAQRVVKLARQRRMTLATVESCTAGSLVNLLAQAEGASEALQGGFVVYTKENKSAAVGVPRSLLGEHTAVSAAVAQAMATGGLDRSPASVVVSVTGVAGPEPDEDGNPVGLVYVAAATRDGRTRVVKNEFGMQPKEQICGASMTVALKLFEEMLAAHVP